MATYIYLGNFPLLDTVNSDFDTESIIPSGTIYDHTVMQLIDVIENDGNGDGAITSDDAFFPTPDSVTYDVGLGSTTQVLASNDTYNVEVTLADNSKIPAFVGITQFQNGDLFVRNSLQLDGQSIQSIEIASLVNNFFSGYQGGSSIDGATIVCFTTGTLISTPEGERVIEALGVGDEVLTMDHGAQPIRWIGSRALDAIDLTHQPKLRPVRIRAGVLGESLPERDLMVSPQHRVLVRSKIAERMFDTREVLIPAIKLVALEGIDVAEDVESVTYWHMLFDTHEIVFSDGAPTESLFTGPEALKSLSTAARDEVTALFPEITAPGYTPQRARPVPEKGGFMKELVMRHAKNNKKLYTME